MRLLFVVLTLLFAVVAPVSGQAGDVQVPFDPAGRIEVIDARLAGRLGLFVDEYPGLREVRLFQASDSSFVLEVTTTRDGRLERRRVPLSAQEARSLRARVAERVTDRAPEAVLNQEGRNLLLTQTALLGFTFYGSLVPTMLGVDDGSTGAGLYLLTAGTSFFLPYVLTQDQNVTRGMATLSGYGASRGLAHGFLLYQMVSGDEEDRSYEDDIYVDHDSGERTASALALLTSVAEGVGGYLWARNEGLTVGEVTAVALGGDYGLAGGLALAYVVGTEGIAEPAAAAMGLAGSAAGITGGRWLAARRDYTGGDAGVMYTSGVVGTLAGLALADVVGLEERPLVTVGMLGAGAGLYLGDRLVRDTDFSTSQASLNALGAGMGGLAGLGTAILVGGDDVDGTAVLTGTAAGALAGFALTYNSLAPMAREQQGESASSWKVRLSPVGMAAGRPAGPSLSVQYRF
jgi:hypothetical protein